MKPSFRTLFAVLMIGAALVAAAASPGAAAGRTLTSDSFAGTWITWWDEGDGVSACSRMYVAAENPVTLDGMWAAPGWNGLLHGALAQTRAGTVWEGEWRDETGSGGFRFVLGAPGARANTFQGTWTVEGSTLEQAWNGVRETDGQRPRVSCTWAD